MTTKLFSKCGLLLLLALAFPKMAFSETIGVFYDAAVPQIKFAASEVKSALEEKGLTVDLLPLSTLSASYANKKVVLALSSNSLATSVLSAQGGTAPSTLGEQAYALRTTNQTLTSFWAFGGDSNGAMYGGLQIAENIKYFGFSGTYNDQVSPTILKRGIKLNLPWDKRSGTYGIGNKGTFDGTSSQLAINDVWDMTFWTSWFDEMARNRYNIVSLWSCNPFSSLVVVPGYEDCSLADVTYYNGTVKTMTINQKIKFWQDVMAYAHARGFEFLFFNWNVFTYGATGKYGITDGLAGSTDPDTRDYMYKGMKKLLETYPDLDGFGFSIGENKGSEDFVWNTYGKAMYDYAKVNPQRKLKLIHRLHYGDFGSMVNLFAPIRTLSNVSFDISIKQSQAHMYSTAKPNWWASEIQDIKNNNLKTWLTVRNDSFYYLTWGDPSYARAYIDGMLSLGNIFKGFYMGCDGYNPTRTFLYKNSSLNGQLEIQRQQYMMMIWGRLSFNKNTSDDVFKNYMTAKYPTVSSANLFTAWANGSRGVQRANEIIHNNYQMDYKWYPEACQREEDLSNNLKRFVTAADFGNADVAPGSLVANIANSASGNLGGKKSTYVVASEMVVDAEAALAFVNTIAADNNSELGLAVNNIKAISYLSLYYAYKIRGATYLKAGATQNANKIAALGSAYCWWMKYANIMDAMYKGMSMQRSSNITDWHLNDAAVLKEYNDNGGVGTPSCTTTDFNITLSANTPAMGTVNGGGVYMAGATVIAKAESNPGFVFVNWTEAGVEASKSATYTFTVSKNTSLVANFKSSTGSTCILPWTDNGFSQGIGTIQKKYGPIDISCAKNGAKISFMVNPVGVDASDICNASYSLNGGTPVLIGKAVVGVANQIFTVNNLIGNSVEIIFDVTTSYITETYNISKIVVSDGTTSLNKFTVSDIGIFPNPTSSILNISFPNNDASKDVQVINALGQLVKSYSIKDSNLKIDVKELGLNGIVFIKVTTANKVTNHKVIVK